MNKFITSLLLALAGLSFQIAHAHGSAQARHGGTVAQAHDLSFELVAREGGIALYIEDHGKPLAPGGMSGTLTVLKGSDKAQYPLVAAADRLEAVGAQLPRGAKAVAVLNAAGRKPMTVRFTIK